MISLERCNRLLDDGFSLITVSENKIPNFPWKQYQDKPISKKDFEKQYSYDGTIKKSDGTFIPKTENIGIVTGYDYLEVVDVDLKVFSTAKEQVDFWNEYYSFLTDNILDFEDKFIVYKTKNAGYHILYKSKRVEGNKKLAKLKGHKEAIIETRGIGGYVFIYDDKNLTEKTYKDVQFVSDEDREILWQISKGYNFIDEVVINETPKNKKQYSEAGLKCWDDFNNKTSLLDLISDEFTVVRNLKDKFVIKRNGAQSTHSGYVFKDSGCMYLFSTGSSYEHEKLYSPFTVYAQKHHRGDLSLAATDLYNQGFGDRIKPLPIIADEKIEIPKDDLIFPIDIFPEILQKYISVCNSTLNNSVDYMGCSLLFVSSVIIGNSMLIEVKRGWRETANLWLALVGKAGVGKTPSINSITFPIEKLNNKEIKAYIKNYEKYESVKELTPEQQKMVEEVKKPKKTQFIVNDITLEALIDLHYENKNGIGVNKDELAGWFKDMNKYRQGSDLEHWLSSWSGKQINLNRKTSKSSFVQRAFIPVLGGIQPSIMDGFYTEENKESGFIDRMLFSFPDLIPLKYSEKEMKQEYLQWYEDYIISFYETIKKLIRYTDDGEIEPYVSRFDADAKKEWIRIHDEIISAQISEDENEYMKSMLPKQLSYIPRFSLIINCLMSNEYEEYTIDIIKKDSVLKAEKLSKYFIAMSKKIKGQSNERNAIKMNLAKTDGKSVFEKFKVVYEKDKTVNKTELASSLGISRTMVYKYVKELESCN